MISPLLANVYLHEALDEWIVKQVAPRLKGRVMLIRYADDFVLLFAREDDARQVHAALPERLAEYGLTLHPDKTRLMHFKQPPRGSGKQPKQSFDFLGFTHHWGRTKRGGWVVKWKTAKDRFSRSLHRIRQWCRRHRHDPLPHQYEALRRKILGHYAYYGVTGNMRRLLAFRDEVQRAWRKWLNRRCWKQWSRTFI